MKELLIPSILVTVLVVTIGQIFWTTPEARNERRRIRAETEKTKTKAFLEKNARSEIDFLTKKYDINILQDQLNKHKKLQSK